MRDSVSVHRRYGIIVVSVTLKSAKRMRSSIATAILLSAVFLVSATTAAQNTESGSDHEIGNCIVVSEIANSRILDDETIRLEMREGSAVLMHLDKRCPQLRFHDFFSYEPTLGQLCAAIDRIVTRAGGSCAIAAFSPVPAADMSVAGGH